MRLTALLPRLLATTALTAVSLAAPAAFANPSGGTVVGGSATVTTDGAVTTIRQSSNRAAIDWQGFSIGRDETTRFIQPTNRSVTLNRVTGSDRSVINGRLEANGTVYLVNPNGVLVGNGAQVQVGGLVASTTDIETGAFMRGRDVFDRPTANPDARVVNRGTITVAAGGLAGLVAPGVENDGVIAASVGTVALGSAETFTVDLAGDGLIAFDTGQTVATTADTQVVQSGRIVNPGGRVLLTAAQAKEVVDSAIDMSGVIEARSVGVEDGVIVLSGAGTTAIAGTIDASGTTGGGTVEMGGETVTVAATATVDASATDAGDGGAITILAAEQATIRGTLRARGGPAGGDGGTIETSSRTRVQVAGATIDASAPAGTAGRWLVDPVDAVLTSNPTDPIDIDIATIVAALDSGTDVEISTVGIGADSGTITLGKPTDVDSDIITTVGGDGLAILTLEANTLIDLNGAFGITNRGGLLGVNLRMVKDPADGPAGGGDINIGRLTADGGDMFVAADASGAGNAGGRVFFSGNTTTINGGQMSLYAFANTIEVDQKIDIDALSLAALDLSPFDLNVADVPAGALFAAVAPIANPGIEFGPVFVTGNVSSITIRDGLDGTPATLAIASESLAMAADSVTGTLPALVRAPTVVLTGPPGQAVNVQTAVSAGGLDLFADDLPAFDFAAIDTLQFGDSFSTLVRIGGTLDAPALGNADLALRVVSGGAIRIGEASTFTPPDSTLIDAGDIALIAGSNALGTIAIGTEVPTTVAAGVLALQGVGTQTIGDNADTTVSVGNFTSGLDLTTGLPLAPAAVIFGGAGSGAGAALPATLDFFAGSTTRIVSAGRVAFAERTNGTVFFDSVVLAIGNLVGDSAGYLATLLAGPVQLGDGGALDMRVIFGRIASSDLGVNNGGTVDIHGVNSLIGFDAGTGGTARIGDTGLTSLTGDGPDSEVVIDYGNIRFGDPSGLSSTMVDAVFIAANASSGDLVISPETIVNGTESVTFALNANGVLDIAGAVSGSLAILAPYAPGQDVVIDTDVPASGLFTQDNIDALTDFDQLIITTATGTGFAGPPAGTSTLTVRGAAPLSLPIDTLIATDFSAGAGAVVIGGNAQPATILAGGDLEILLAASGVLTLAGLIDSDGGDVSVDAVAAAFANIVLDGDLTIDTIGTEGNGAVTLAGNGAFAAGQQVDFAVLTGAPGDVPGSRGTIDFSALDIDDATGLRDVTLRGGALIDDEIGTGRHLTVDIASTPATIFTAGADPTLGPGDLSLTALGDLAGIAVTATGNALINGGGAVVTALVTIGGNLDLMAQSVAILTDAAAGLPGAPASGIGGDATISGAAVIIADPAEAGFRPIAFGGDLTVNAATAAGLFDLTLAQGALSVTAPQTVLFGAITTARNLTIDGNLVLTPFAGGGTSSLASARDLTITGLIDAVPSGPGETAPDLVLSGRTVTLQGAIGSALPLAGLSVTAATLIDPPNVTTTGSQSYNAPLTIFTGTAYRTGGGDFVVAGAADFQSADATVDTRGGFADAPGDIAFGSPGTPQDVHATGNLTFITRGLLRLAGSIDTDGGDFTIRNRTTGATNLLIDGDVVIDTAAPGGGPGGTVAVQGVGGTSGTHDVTLRTGPADPDLRGDIDFSALDFQGLGGGLGDVLLVGRDILADGMAAGHDLTVDARALVAPAAVALGAGLDPPSGPGDLLVTLARDLAGAVISATGDATLAAGGAVSTSLVQVGGDLRVDAGGPIVLADLFAGSPAAPASLIGGDTRLTGAVVVVADPAAAGARTIGFGGDLDIAANTTASLFNLAVPGGHLTVDAAQALLVGDITTRDTLRVTAPQILLGGDLTVARNGQDLVLQGNVLLVPGIGAGSTLRTLDAADRLVVTGTIDGLAGAGLAPLGLVATADTVELGGVIGGLAPLASLGVTATSLIDPPNVTTFGDQRYEAPQLVFVGDRYRTGGGAFTIVGSARFDAPSVTVDTTDGSAGGAIALGTGSTGNAMILTAGPGAVTATNIALDSLSVLGALGSAAMTGTIGGVGGEPAAIAVDRGGLTTASYLFNGCVMAVGCLIEGPEIIGDRLPPTIHDGGPPAADTGTITGVGPTVQRPTSPPPVVVQSVRFDTDDQRFRFSNTGKDQFWRLDVDEPDLQEGQP